MVNARHLGLIAAVAALVGCFEIRPLDLSFDASVDPDRGSTDVGPDTTPGCTSTDKTCDGVDDDCDGQADEDWTGQQSCGIGQCALEATPARCVSGFIIDCLPSASEPEGCNALDDDCDGSIDEDLTERCGENEGTCRRGTSVCEDGVWSDCDAVGPVDELCDGRDNDCDGNLDEGLTRACGGAGGGVCGEGVETCDDGDWQGCDAVEPSEEQCNGIDDDCDGLIDEVPDRPCGIDEGACQQGVETCQNGAFTSCQGAVVPVNELCNEQDDDCDGNIDEGDDPRCGACALEPRPVCLVGEQACDPGRDVQICVRPLGVVEGQDGEGLGRALATMRDANGDGWDDLFVGGTGVVVGISGGDRGVLFRRGDAMPSFGSVLAAADVDGDGTDDLLVGTPGAERGLISAFSPEGVGFDTIPGDESVHFGQFITAVDGQEAMLTGDPQAGLVRTLQFNGEDFEGGLLDTQIEDGLRGPILAVRDDQQQPLVLVTVGPADGSSVRTFYRPFDPGSNRSERALDPGPGVGGHLATGEWRRNGPTYVFATNRDVATLDLARLDGDSHRRYPLDAVALDLAASPQEQGEGTLAGVFVGLPGRIQILARGNNNAAHGFSLDGDADAGFGHSVAVGAGPDGGQILAVGAPTAAGGRGRVFFYRVE